MAPAGESSSLPGCRRSPSVPPGVPPRLAGHRRRFHVHHVAPRAARAARSWPVTMWSVLTTVPVRARRPIRRSSAASRVAEASRATSRPWASRGGRLPRRRRPGGQGGAHLRGRPLQRERRTGRGGRCLRRLRAARPPGQAHADALAATTRADARGVPGPRAMASSRSGARRSRRGRRLEPCSGIFGRGLRARPCPEQVAAEGRERENVAVEVVVQGEVPGETGAREPGLVPGPVCRLGTDEPVDAPFGGRVVLSPAASRPISAQAVWEAVDVPRPCQPGST